MEYSFEELEEIHFWYGAARGNALDAQRLYGEKYPNRRLPNRKTFTRLAQRMRTTGMLFSRRSGGYDQCEPDLDDRVLWHIENNPRTSTRNIAAVEGVSHSTVWTILKKHQLRPYHFQEVQELEPADYERRLNFCRWMTQRMAENEDFFSQVLFTDESTFNRYGAINHHNDHIWASENPRMIRETHTQRQFSLNVWAGILNNKIIGPVFLPSRLTGQLYREFLQTQLHELLEDQPLQIRRNMWFMHDGAPPHYTMAVREYLDEYFENKWIGRGGPVPWPARSPDLNLLDFFFWGNLKSKVYKRPVNTVEELRTTIQVTSALIEDFMPDFDAIKENFRRRVFLCIQENGGHFEHLM